ncbi:hypothetical protein NEUTE1DRAFT_119250 [Neurospora tetrasperma FGSC 2508]|uniref:Uncharacterized protein n=1 Tax=Neurospora tetrasperma (strain FGSC 2508 / ATCC MYA-4615 / P0657) TaxID=510951 RepID=F8N533_NEUT8|nr:uncharacterized protein NEUTE1DRAFT_119250 [Neurospora tetrasperma FGSC 2508]EGO53614.1 hypothetical protein NEUTE1DRAFT_119250 [Neurospora tetrasperma FGSC 2508]
MPHHTMYDVYGLPFHPFLCGYFPVPGSHFRTFPSENLTGVPERTRRMEKEEIFATSNL